MQSRPDQSVSILGIVMDPFNIANLTPFPFVSINKWSTISSFPLHTVSFEVYINLFHTIQWFTKTSIYLLTANKREEKWRKEEFHQFSLVCLFGVGDSSWAVHSSIWHEYTLLRILLCSVHVSTRNNSWLLRSRMPGEVYPSQIYSGHYKRHPNLLQAWLCYRLVLKYQHQRKSW